MAEELLDCANVVARSSRCVAKECRNVWQVTRFSIAASFEARCTARCTFVSCR
jgi:hypothetical protein